MPYCGDDNSDDLKGLNNVLTASAPSLTRMRGCGLTPR